MAENQIDLKFVTDVTQLEKAGKVADQVERKVKKLVDQEKRGKITTDQYSKAVGLLATQFQKASGGSIVARNEVFSYSRAAFQAAQQTEELGSDLDRTSVSFSNIGHKAQVASGKMNQFGRNIDFSGKKVNRFGAYAQQAGYQVGDFAVQLQSGTNWAVSLGQQGSQLLGIFGPAGAIAGAALAISTAFIIPFTKANKELDDMISKLEEANILRGIGGDPVTLRIAETTRNLTELENQINRIEKGVANRIKGREGTTYQEEMERLLEVTKEANKSLYDARDAEITKLRILQNQKRVQEALKGDQELEAENLKANNDRRLQNEQDLYNQMVANQQAFNSLVVDSTKKLADERKSAEDDVYESMLANQESLLELQGQAIIEATNISKEFAEDVKAAGGDAEKLAKIDLASGISAAAIQASMLSEEMKTALLAALELVRHAKTAVSLDPFGGAGPTVSPTVWPKRTGSRGKSPVEQLKEYMKKQEDLVKLQTRQIGLSEEQARIEELKNKYVLAGLEPNMERIQTLAAEEEQLRKTTEAEQKRKNMMETIEGHIENAFMAMVDGSSSVEDAFKGMLRNILLDIYQQQVAEPIAKGIGSFLSGLFADGAAFRGGRVTPFANGGVVSSPTLFPMANGTGLMGEAGPEAIMPLKRGPNGKLGVEVQGGSSNSVTVIQNNTFGNGVSKAEINAMMPKIVETTKAAVFDAQRRSVSGRGY